MNISLITPLRIKRQSVINSQKSTLSLQRNLQTFPRQGTKKKISKPTLNYLNLIKKTKIVFNILLLVPNQFMYIEEYFQMACQKPFEIMIKKELFTI
jgi:hypothetical protein